MLILTIALRNILRNRRRSVITLLAMVVGVQAILIFGGFSGDIARGLETGYVQRSGHLQIQHNGYFLLGASNPSQYQITDYEKIIAAIRADDELKGMVKVVTPTLSFSGIAGNFSAGASKPVVANGVAIEDMDKMRGWDDFHFNLPPRHLALLGTPDDATAIGTGVARMLQLCTPLGVSDCESPTHSAKKPGPSLPADIAAIANEVTQPQQLEGGAPYLELLAATADGAPNVARLQVVKAERYGSKEADDSTISLHLSAAQRLLFGSNHKAATAILIQLEHSDQMAEALGSLRLLLNKIDPEEPLEIHDFTVLNPFYGQVISMFESILGFISVLIAVIVMFTVGNTMNMAIMERTVEIGTLRALGERRRTIRMLFLYEGILLGVTGAAIGFVIATTLAAAINHSGITWVPPGGTNRIPISVHFSGETRMMIITFIGAVFVSSVSAWWPARRAALMPVVDALRHV